MAGTARWQRNDLPHDGENDIIILICFSSILHSYISRHPFFPKPIQTPKVSGCFDRGFLDPSRYLWSIGFGSFDGSSSSAVRRGRLNSSPVNWLESSSLPDILPLLSSGKIEEKWPQGIESFKRWIDEARAPQHRSQIVYWRRDQNEI